MLYRSLKLHFNDEKYDYFKYHGKLKCPMMPLNQEHIFRKLNARYSKKIEDFYVANFLKNSYVWVNELLSEECHDIFLEYTKKKDSLTYLYKSDIIKLLDIFETFENSLKVNKDFPPLLKEVFYEKIHLESLIISNSILNFFDIWDKEIDDEIIWKPFKMKCMKYRPFIKYDKAKMENILFNMINYGQS